MKVAFTVENLARGGGQIMVAKQASALARAGHEVFIVHDEYKLEAMDLLDAAVQLVPRSECGTLPTMDLVLFSWWRTGLWCQEVAARSYGQYMQSVEDRFSVPWAKSDRAWALQMQTLGWPTITEAHWIQDWLSRIAPHQPTYLARNGIDKSVFPPTPPKDRDPQQPLRVVVEGSSAWFKWTRVALQGVAGSSVPVDLTYVAAWSDWVDEGIDMSGLRSYRRLHDLSHDQMADLLRNSDLMVKLPTVEGMPGPPLEAMHCGATVIATRVLGIEEYAVHGGNSILVPFNDPVSVSNWIDALYHRPELLESLRLGAYHTAQAWLSDEESGGAMDAAVRRAADHRFIPDRVPDMPEPEDIVGVWDQPHSVSAPLDSEAAIADEDRTYAPAWTTP